MPGKVLAVQGRFIPAYAGNALALQAILRFSTVHPRIRGERGGVTVVQATSVRFIPAYAGNAGRVWSVWGSAPVHPRIRGERAFGLAWDILCSGSSPHTRGTRDFTVSEFCGPRFIPAYAGNAGPMATTDRPAAVHPRIRGERWRACRRSWPVSGSSPHTRGTHDDGRAVQILIRFIPAYAGNAARSMPSCRPETVHPRIRGERSHGVSGSATVAGSSPHTRGTLLPASDE